MMELIYIPLKTADGNVCGYACARGGAVTLSLRSHLGGEAHIFTDGGYITGPVQSPIRVNGVIDAVAVLRAGLLYCSGFRRNSPMDITALRARLNQAKAASPAAPAPVKPFVKKQAPRPKPETVPQEPALFPAPKAAARQPDADALPVPQPEKTRQEDDFDPDAAVAQALKRLAGTAAGAFFPASEKVPPEPAEAAAAFSALLTRADAVFARASVLPETPAPAPESPARQAAEAAREEPWFKAYLNPDPEPAPPQEPVKTPRQFSPRDWAADIERPADAPVLTPAENPFPHIFPEARFQRETGPGGERLLGQWRRGSESFHITAVLGEYSPQPPARLSGFTRYIRTRSGGYWVRVEDM